MSRVVLDASAVLALLFKEPGAEKVIARGKDGIISAVSYSETVAKSLDRGVPLETVQHALAGMKLTLVPFDAGTCAHCGNLPASHATPQRLLRRPRLFGDGVAGPPAGADGRPRLGRVRPRRQTHPDPVGDVGAAAKSSPERPLCRNDAARPNRRRHATPPQSCGSLEHRRSSPGRNSSRARSPTTTPGKITFTPSASSSPGPRTAAWNWSASRPGDVGEYFQDLPLAVPTKKLHLAALRKFFDRHGQSPRRRHQPGRDSAGGAVQPSSKARRRRCARTGSDAAPSRSTLTTTVGKRDPVVLAVLIYTAARVGAVARLALKSLQHDGTQYTLRFAEKGGKVAGNPGST